LGKESDRAQTTEKRHGQQPVWANRLPGALRSDSWKIKNNKPGKGECKKNTESGIKLEKVHIERMMCKNCKVAYGKGSKEMTQSKTTPESRKY